jgi:hypothetical protein
MRPKLILLSLALALASALTAFAQTQEAAKGAPKMIINKVQHDFGQLKQGQLAQYSFTFRNEGAADLLINNVAPS